MLLHVVWGRPHGRIWQVSACDGLGTALLVQQCVAVCILTDAGLEILAQQEGRAEHLRILRLARCNHVTDEGLVHLRTLQALQELDLNGCHRLNSTATGKTLAKLPNLTYLDVSYCPNIL